MVSELKIQEIGSLLRNHIRPLKERFRALFTLKNIGGETSVKEISYALSDSSALLKHELAYCLGQMGNPIAIPILIKVLEDVKEDPMVRHEAGEALGAIGCPSAENILKRYCNDPVTEVAETCDLALCRIQWLKSNGKKVKNSSHLFLSVDPSPPSEELNLSLLEKTLLDDSLPLFDRYKAMFSLRNINSPDSAKILAKGFSCFSALFRHEIAYVLGQMALRDVEEDLIKVVRNKEEKPMVRHEAAEALGSIGSETAIQILKEFLNDETRVVRESCEVALDISDYENSSEFQYANALLKV
ncbi:UNVERIFIED_CONTAM: hypothetical protein RMT77_008392 [Armadillidium vulgare]